MFLNIYIIWLIWFYFCFPYLCSVHLVLQKPLGFLGHTRGGWILHLFSFSSIFSSLISFSFFFNNYYFKHDKIFQVLYLFITFGVSRDPEIQSDYDPPDHLFRLRLVTTLLDTCGQFFSSGSSKKRLDCFLTFFQVII